MLWKAIRFARGIDTSLDLNILSSWKPHLPLFDLNVNNSGYKLYYMYWSVAYGEKEPVLVAIIVQLLLKYHMCVSYMGNMCHALTFENLNINGKLNYLAVFFIYFYIFTTFCGLCVNIVWTIELILHLCSDFRMSMGGTYSLYMTHTYMIL